MHDMNILVTGGAGFIGSHLVERLLCEGYETLALDNFDDFYDPASKWKNLVSVQHDKAFQLIQGDIRDRELLDRIFRSKHIETVVHLAGRPGVRASIMNPSLYEDINIKGTLSLLEACRKYDVPKLVFGSSSSVYGRNEGGPFREMDDVDHPVSVYAATKRAGELLCHVYHQLHGLHVICLRFFSVYGPKQRPDMAIHKFTQMIDRQTLVPMYGDGSSKRDYTYISDIVDGLLSAIERCKGYKVYNLGTSRTIRLRDLIDLIADALGKEAAIEVYPDQPGDVPVTCADTTKAQKELGYEAHIGIEEGIRRFVDWYRERQHLLHGTPGVDFVGRGDHPGRVFESLSLQRP